MARKAEYKLDTFRKLVKAGKSKSEIMKEMKIKGYPQFSSLELRLFKEDKEVYDIPTGRPSNADNIVCVGKKENITIPKSMISNTDYKIDDKFQVTFRGKNKIILTLIEK